jgi:hypothetical protein
MSGHQLIPNLSNWTNPVVQAVAVWSCFFLFYVLFSGETSVAELVAGVTVGGLAAIYQVALRCAAGSTAFSFSALRPLVEATGAVLRDTPRVALALVQAILGGAPASRVRITAAPAGADPIKPAGRAIAITAGSLAPNSVVVASVFDRREIVVHRLVDSSPAEAA